MKRRGKILKWMGIITAVAIAILLMLNTYFVWSTGTELERRLATLRLAGDPVQISDFAREPIPPEKNAEAFLLHAADDLDAIDKELLALYPRVCTVPWLHCSSRRCSGCASRASLRGPCVVRSAF